MTACADCASPTRRSWGLRGVCDPEIESAAAIAARTFESLGARVEWADPDIGEDPIETWNTFWWPSMLYQLQAFGDRARELSDPALLEAAAQSHAVSVFDTIRAQLHRAHLHNVMAKFHETYDLLLTPSLPLPAFEVGDLVPRSGDWGTAWCDWAPFSYPVQPDDAAGSLGAVRAHESGLADRAADRRRRSERMPWSCVRAAPSKRPVPFATLDAPRTGELTPRQRT